MAWHARGQGFKSPQLHPRSAAQSDPDRPPIARLGQQIGSNLFCKAHPVVPRGSNPAGRHRCRRPVDPGTTEPPAARSCVMRTGIDGHGKVDHRLATVASS
jgi:hypothetical protein